jgi:SAM-dependent methyltransferase
MRDYHRLDRFLSSLHGDVYPEAPVEPHISITHETIQELHDARKLRAGMRVLDIGCGQGIALEKFRALGLEAVGITLGPDAEICRAKGFTVYEMDQNFMTFADHEFDLLWCRHVLEHSIAPFFTLSEYRRAVKPGGFVYVEVPAPDTSVNHQTNPNHYSVLPLSAWDDLFARSGFTIEKRHIMKLKAQSGTDAYWGFHLRSPSVAS